jgi:hypothetical protein
MTVSPYKWRIKAADKLSGRVATIDLELKFWGGNHERRPVMAAPLVGKE